MNRTLLTAFAILAAVALSMAFASDTQAQNCNQTLGGGAGNVAWAWGDNHDGQLGDGTTDDRLSAVQVPFPQIQFPPHLRSWPLTVAGGEDHSLALKTDGTVWAWGSNFHGQLGNGTNTNSLTPVQVQNLSGVIAIAGGGWYSLALKNDGTVWAWGNNEFGQLGDGTNDDRHTPVQVLNVSGVIAIAAGGLNSLASEATP